MIFKFMLHSVFCIFYIALSAALTACGGTYSLPGASGDYWEQGNNHSSSQAEVMALDYNPGTDSYDYTGRIASDDRADDWFRVSTTQSGQVSITLTCGDLSGSEQLDMRLYNSALSELDDATIYGSSGNSVTVYSSGSSPAGYYYVRISSDSWSHSYDLEPSFTGGVNANDYWETEHNDSSNQADALPLTYDPVTDGYDYTGSIATDDTSDDWYRLTTTSAGQLTLTLSCDDLAYTEQLYIQLYDSVTNELDASSLSGSTSATTSVSTSTNTSAGTFYVRISAHSWTHRYDLNPGFNTSSSAYDFWEMENNDNSYQADEMSLNYDPGSDGYDYTGEIAATDTSDDWYRLTTTSSGQLSVILYCTDLSAGEQLSIRLYDSGLNTLDAKALSGTIGGSTAVYTSSNAPAGVYYAEISSASWPHRYDLTPGFYW